MRPNWLQISLLSAILVFVVSISGVTSSKISPSSSIAATQDSSEISSETIIVQGVGAISVSPDWAVIKLGVEQEANTVEKAQAATAKAINNIKASLLENGVEEKHIRTTNFNVYPNYRYDNDGNRTLQGYTVRHMLSVEHGEIDQVGKLVDGATAAGANRIDSVQFTLKDQSSLEIEALEEAMNHAQAKAEALAKTANKQIVTAQHIVENNNNFSNTYVRMAALESADTAGTVIEAGQIEIVKNITVTYLMK